MYSSKWIISGGMASGGVSLWFTTNPGILGCLELFLHILTILTILKNSNRRKGTPKMHDKITINTWIPVSEFGSWAEGSWIGALVYFGGDEESDTWKDCYCFYCKLGWSVTI